MLIAIAPLILMASGSPPEVTCEISMKSWCIVQLPSVIEMIDMNTSREWTIKTNQDTARAQVSIIEDKFCDGQLNPVLHPGPDHDTLFIRSDQGCGLRIIVSNHDDNVKPEVLVRNIIMLKDGNHWLSLTSRDE